MGRSSQRKSSVVVDSESEIAKHKRKKNVDNINLQDDNDTRVKLNSYGVDNPIWKQIESHYVNDPNANIYNTATKYNLTHSAVKTMCERRKWNKKRLELQEKTYLIKEVKEDLIEATKENFIIRNQKHIQISTLILNKIEMALKSDTLTHTRADTFNRVAQAVAKCQEIERKAFNADELNETEKVDTIVVKLLEDMSIDVEIDVKEEDDK